MPDLAEARAVVVEDGDRGADDQALLHLFNLLRERNPHAAVDEPRTTSTVAATLPDLTSRLATVPVVAIRAPDDALLAALMVKLFSDRRYGSAKTCRPMCCRVLNGLSLRSVPRSRRLIVPRWSGGARSRFRWRARFWVSIQIGRTNKFVQATRTGEVGPGVYGGGKDSQGAGRKLLAHPRGHARGAMSGQANRQFFDAGIVADDQDRIHVALHAGDHGAQSLGRCAVQGGIEDDLRLAQSRLHKSQGLACAHRGRAQDDIGLRLFLLEPGFHVFGGLAAALDQRPLQIVPRREPLSGLWHDAKGRGFINISSHMLSLPILPGGDNRPMPMTSGQPDDINRVKEPAMASTKTVIKAKASTGSKPQRHPHHKALAHLKCDERMAAVIATVGPYLPSPIGDGFHALVRAIVSQQVPNMRPRQFWDGCMRFFPDGKPDARMMLKFRTPKLLGVGLSRSKGRLSARSRQACDGTAVSISPPSTSSPTTRSSNG